jgi:hypothetical protein
MWAPYGGRDAIALAVVLIVVAASLAYLGTRLRRPIHVGSPGRTAGTFMVVIWVLAICTFLVAEYAYLTQIKQVLLFAAPPKGQGGLHRTASGVGTLPDAAVTFFVILYLTGGYGWKVALGSAFVGTAAAPMFFELPFDLIVMGRTYPAVPPSPALYRALFFLPLFIVEFSTISLLTLLSSMRVTRQAFFALAAMFVVFAVWAVFGFAPPTTAPLPKTLNVISKMLCFVTAIMLFIRPTLLPSGQT